MTAVREQNAALRLSISELTTRSLSVLTLVGASAVLLATPEVKSGFTYAFFLFALLGGFAGLVGAVETGTEEDSHLLGEKRVSPDDETGMLRALIRVETARRATLEAARRKRSQWFAISVSIGVVAITGMVLCINFGV